MLKPIFLLVVVMFLLVLGIVLARTARRGDKLLKQALREADAGEQEITTTQPPAKPDRAKLPAAAATIREEVC